MKLLRLALLLTLAVTSAMATPSKTTASADSLEALVSRKLPALGHRNWIVIADSAYPLQTAPGIETITVSDGQLEAVQAVLKALGKTKHVRPNILLDKELSFVSEKNCKGIGGFRTKLDRVLRGRNAEKMLHEQIISKLDTAGKSFKVLLIKTPHVMPYTSVFFELNCGYWSDQAERELRDAMKEKAQ